MTVDRQALSLQRCLLLPVVLAAASLLMVTSIQAQESDLADQAYQILKENCSTCHQLEVKVPKFYVLERESLVGIRGEDLDPYITPGSPEKSLIWQYIEGEDPADAIMPPDGGLSTDQQAVIRQWIEAGADFPLVVDTNRPYIPEAKIIELIADHLSRVNSNDRKFQRYFSIAHLHNNQSVESKDLRKYRAAFSKVVNHMSRQPAIVIPEAIDENETIFNIDLRRVGWEDLEVWDEVVRAYPYGLKPQRQEFGTEEYRRVEDLFGQVQFDGMPYMRIDWFVVTASRPPLYHVLLDIPETLDELLDELDIDIKRNLELGLARRGGMFESGVSRQNRLVEYHPSRGGFWISYDFGKNAGRSNLARFPLGPKAFLPDFESKAFEHAGGEIIFSLRNGLSGYMLIDNEGNRIDRGPIDIVSDLDETSGTPEIVTGISCMNCHKRGTRPFLDDIRSSDAIFEQTAQEKVAELYAPHSEMNALLEQGSRDYMRQLEKAIGPFLQAGDDADTPFKKLADAEEPVKYVARQYDRNLTLETAARELGYDDPSTFGSSLEIRSLAQLGLGPLRAERGTIKRSFWDSRESGISIYQEAASQLGRGTPVP